MLGQALECGRFGVDLFFVLSGFLITGILIDTRHDPRYFRNFFGRRALRILPLYYGVLGTLLLLSIPFHWHWNGMAPLLLTYTQNLRPSAIDTLAIGPGIGLFHFWSLAIEEQFYFLWPPLVFALRGRLSGVFRVALLGSVLVLCLRIGLVLVRVPYLWIHMSLFTRADALLLGALAAVLYRNGNAWARAQRLSPCICTILSVTLLLPILLRGIQAGSALWLGAFRYTALAVCFSTLLIWSLKPGSWAKQAFEASWMRILGRYSYSLYVLHVLIVSLVRLPLREALITHTGSRALAVAATGLVCILLSLVAAYLSYHLLERPFLRLKCYFAYTEVAPARVEPLRTLV